MAENNLTIVINGNVNGLNAAIMNAEKHLTKFEQTTHNVTQNINQYFKEAATGAAVIGTAFKSVGSIINQYIISPLSGAVNGFMTLGDQISKTFQRIGIGVESLSGVGAARRELSYSHGRNIVNFYHRCGVPLFRNKKAGIMEFIH